MFGLNCAGPSSVGSRSRRSDKKSTLPCAMCSMSSLVLSCLVLQVLGVISAAHSSRVHVDPTDNAYRGVVVAISPKIKPHYGKVIIPNLEVSHSPQSTRKYICVSYVHAEDHMNNVLCIYLPYNTYVCTCKTKVMRTIDYGQVRAPRWA